MIRARSRLQLSLCSRQFIVAACAGALLLISNVSLRAATIMLDIDSMGMNIGEVTVLTNDDVPMGSNGDVKANFVHNQMNFAEAAEAAWGGHFNWLNIVRSGTANTTPDDPDQPGQQQVGFPWVDPLPGGNLGFGFNLVDDMKPFYWSEENTEVADATNEGTNTFMFFDRPENDPNVMWNFETYLVAVPGPVGQMAAMTFHILGGFKWKFNENAMDENLITNLMEIPVNAMTINALIADINNVLDRHDAFEDWSVTSHIPEPTSLTLLGITALGFCGVRIRRRRHDVRPVTTQAA